MNRKPTIGHGLMTFMGWSTLDLIRPTEKGSRTWLLVATKDYQRIVLVAGSRRECEATLAGLEAARRVAERELKARKAITSDTLRDFSNEDLLEEMELRCGFNARYQSEVRISEEEMTKRFWSHMLPAKKQVIDLIKDLDITIDDAFYGEVQDLLADAKYDNELLRLAARLAYTSNSQERDALIRELRHTLRTEFQVYTGLAASLI